MFSSLKIKGEAFTQTLSLFFVALKLRLRLLYYANITADTSGVVKHVTVLAAMFQEVTLSSITSSAIMPSPSLP